MRWLGLRGSANYVDKIISEYDMCISRCTGLDGWLSTNPVVSVAVVISASGVGAPAGIAITLGVGAFDWYIR